MKIIIVTLPLHFNYGGVLQAYALQSVLQELGHEAYVLKENKYGVKSFIKLFLYSRSKIGGFVKENINYMTFHLPFDKKELAKKKIDKLVVGSDQVWRPSMGNDRIQNIKTFFLETTEGTHIDKLSYAASFGIDGQEFTQEELTLAQQLIKDFNAVSVREQSGILLSDKLLGVKDAKLVLDPTMLITIEKYSSFFEQATKKGCFVYVLNNSSSFSEKVLKSIVRGKMEVTQMTVSHNLFKRYYNSNDSIENWLAAICNSQLMITDSFHGCVFSILFHTDFYVMHFSNGGNTRIDSLLSLFGLKDRLISQTNIPTKNTPIDWQSVDEILLKKRAESIEYIKEAIAK